MSRDFTGRLAAFAGAHGIPRIDFARGQRKMTAITISAGATTLAP